MIEFLIGVLLAAGAVWSVLQPIFRPLPAGSGPSAAGSVDDGEDPEEDLTPRAVALRALREIEFDRATGKLSDADYDELHRKYTAEALAAMRAEGAGSGRRDAGSEGPPVTPLPASRISPPACAVHGARPEPDALFCSECGRRLGTNPGYCSRCGAGLEADARYCNACGSRVAA